MSLSFESPKSVVSIKNRRGVVGGVRYQPKEDFLLVTNRNVINKTKEEIEGSVGVTSQQKNLPIEYLEELRRPLAAQRNEIIDDPLKYYNPFWWTKLREIDEKLDMLDLQIYKLRKTNFSKKDDLDKIIEDATRKVDACFALLKSK